MINVPDQLQIMLDMQQSLQLAIHEKYPQRVPDPTKLSTCGEILDWIRLQDEFIADETRELHTSLGGDSLGREAAGVWKYWKANHEDLRNTKFCDLSEADQKAVKMEMIDIFHFVMCKFIGLGMDSNEIFELYYEKNAENFKRQEENY